MSRRRRTTVRTRLDRELDQGLRRIAVRAAFLWEGEHRTRRRSMSGSTSAALIDRRLSRWRNVVAQGDVERFRRRLHHEGLTEPAARRLLADGRASSAGRQPPWTHIVRAMVVTGRSDDLAAVAGLPVRGCSDPQDPVPFEDLLFPAIAAARRKLLARNRGLERELHAAPSSRNLSERAYLQIERALLMRLSTVAAPAFDAEFAGRRTLGQNLLLQCGVQPPSPPVCSDYHAFVAELRGDGLLSFFEKFPVVARLMAVAVELWVDAANELLVRLKVDRPAIAQLLARGSAALLGPVAAVACDLGDPHRGGRAVMSLTFASGARVIYKPRSIGLEAAYTQLLRWINGRGALLPLHAQAVLDRGEYGWVEHIDAWPCADAEAVRRFYRRAGMLQGLLYAIGATDCHAENLVACGEHPVLIDAEALMQPRVAPIAQEEGYFDSVLQTGLLPQWECQRDTRYPVSVSGLAVEAAPPVPRQRWKFINTDVMHRGWSVEAGSPAANAPHLDGALAPPDGFGDELVEGFEEMYRWLMENHRAIVAPDGPLAAFRRQEARFLYRATQTYANIAEAAMRPECLQSGVDWSIELDHLAVAPLATVGVPAAWQLLRAERQAMSRLDVPYFAVLTSESKLRGTDKPLRGYLAASGYDETIARLSRFGEQDLALQSEILRGTLQARALEPHSSSWAAFDRAGAAPAVCPRVSTVEPSATPLADEAVAIGHLLRERMIELSRDRLNWLGFTYIRNNDRIQVSLLSPNLYDGVCGVAVFLAALSRVTGTKMFGDLALRALLPVRDAVRTRRSGGPTRLADQLGLGGGLGLGSVLYAFCKASAFLDDSSLLDDALLAAQAITPRHIRGDDRLDVMGGAAGAILGLLALHASTGVAAPLRRAIACGRHLLNAQIARGPHAGSWRPDANASRNGFAHGASGISVALLRLYAVTGDKPLRRSAERGLAFERSAVLTKRTGSAARQEPVSWCHGPAGVGLSCLNALSIINSDAILDAARVAVRRTRQEGTRGLDQLCCGSMGRIETLLSGATLLDRPGLATTARAQALEVVERARAAGGYRLTGTASGRRGLDNTALFQGLSGIGYQLLRLAYPDAVPSLLLFT